MECPFCGALVEEDDSHCHACGATLRAEGEGSPPDSAGDRAPEGTWSEGQRSERPEAQADGGSDEAAAEGAGEVVPHPSSRPRPMLTVHQGEGRGSEADLTPVPGLALALAPIPPDDQDGDHDRPETGTHRAAQPAADVVPLRPNAIVATTEAAPAQPPVLASKLLAEDLQPRQPYRRLGPSVYGLSGLAAAGMLFLPQLDPQTIFAGGMLALVGAVGLLPLRYQHRALAAFLLSSGGIALALVAQASEPSGPLRTLLTVGVGVLSAGLLLRHAHRGSGLSRALVLAGVLAGAGWLALATQTEPLHTVELVWTSWVPAALKGLLFVLGLLSLLAFMDTSTRGGCAVWATLLLMWFHLEIAQELSSLAYVGHPVRPAAAWFLGPLLASLALSGAQLLATARTDRTRRALGKPRRSEE